MDDQNKNLILATALSFAVILVWFVMFPPEEPAVTPETPPVAPVDGDAPAPDGVSVELRLSVVNFDHFQQRYTRSALEALLADYHHLLREVAVARMTARRELARS